MVDGFGLPIESADQYLRWLLAVGRSVNTVRTYAHHVALLFRWLGAHRLSWDGVDFDQLIAFVSDLAAGRPPLLKRGGGQRDDDTVRTVASAVREFYEFHRVEGRGPAELVLTRTVVRSGQAGYHFLAHVERRRPAQRNRLARPAKASSPRDRAHELRLIAFEEDFRLLVQAAGSRRDALLLSSFYDVGLRVGQSLGLRHEDLDPMRRRIRVERRPDNVNGALSKQPVTFWASAPSRFFDYYRDYLVDEFMPAGVDSDYVFVNLHRRPVGRPCSYSNVHQMVRRAGRAISRPDLHPHALRHTHATALAKAGWTTAEIAARLGQSFPSSADVYIHLANGDLQNRLEATQHLIWPETPERGTR